MWQRNECDETGVVSVSYNQLDSIYVKYNMYVLLGLKTDYDIENYDREENIKLYKLILPTNPSNIQLKHYSFLDTKPEKDKRKSLEKVNP
jgi:hypothetical protein